MNDPVMSVGQLASLACVMEVTIPKPGNVHRNADFEDATLQDFLTSAVAIGPSMDRAPSQSLGDTVLGSVRATRRVVDTNTNLGIILLLAPLAMVDQPNPQAIAESLQRTNSEDCRKIYKAIALCQPGGMGKREQFDVNADQSPDHILDAMRMVQDDDMIARQYVNGFRDVFDFVLPGLETVLQTSSLADAVIQTHLRTMSQFPDSLIYRKNGTDVAMQSAAMAGHVLSSGQVGDALWLKSVSDFDFWLRADGNRRNPGTTADLIAAALFLGLSRGTIELPCKY